MQVRSCDLMRILIFMYGLSPHFGPGSQVNMLARELKHRGHEVSVFSQTYIPPDNQYLQMLEKAGIAVLSPGDWILSLEEWTWTNRLLLVPLLPLRLVLTVGDVLIRRRTWQRAWRGVRGRLNRYIPSHKLGDWSKIWAKWKLSRVHKSTPFTLVHTFSGKGIVFEWAHQHSVKLIYNENIVPNLEEGVNWWDDVVQLPNSVHLTISVCSAAETAIRDQLRYLGPIAVVPPMLKDPLREQMPTQHPPTEEGKLVLGIASRLDTPKGHVYLLSALQELSKAGNVHWELLIAGEGPERESLEKLIETLGIQDSVRLLGGLNSTQMEGFWRQIDVFVLASLWEGVPVAILEAMAHSKPVVGTDVGGVAEAVVNGETGLVVPARDVEALANAIQYLAESPKQRQRMGEAGRARFLTRFSTDAVTTQYLEVYEKVARDVEFS